MLDLWVFDTSLGDRSFLLNLNQRLGVSIRMGWGWTVTIMPYGNELRRARQLYHRFLQRREVSMFADIQTSEIRKMVARFISKPDRLLDQA
jgi:hypothetical protein